MSTISPYLGDGSTTDFNITFPFRATDAVRVRVDGVDVQFTLLSGSQVRTLAPPAADSLVEVYRKTPVEVAEAVFSDGQIVKGADLNRAVAQPRDRAEELEHELQSVGGRAILLPESSNTPLPSKSRRAGRFLAFDYAGDPTVTDGDAADFTLRDDLAADGSALVRAIDGRSVQDNLDQLNQPQSDEFYSEAGARIQRLRDRVFAGAAAKHTGTNDGVQPDWLTQYLVSKGRTFGFLHVTTMACLSEINTAGQNAFVSAAHTAELTAMGNAIGVLGVGINDNTGQNTGAWGLYGEVFQNAGALGPCYASELDTINFASYITIDPYGQQSQQVIGLQIASGAEFLGTFDATAGINFWNNGARFGVGLNFGYNSLRGTNGDGSGIATAIQMARGHGLRWLATGTEVTSGIYSIGGSGALGQSLWFDDYLAAFQNTETGKRTFAVLNIGPTGVNYLRPSNSATGVPVQMSAQGDDANIGIILTPKGSEYLWFGTYTPGALTPTGYMTIKDAGGAIRRLLVG